MYKKIDVIELVDISKKYFLYHEKPTLVENVFNVNKSQAYWALKNISLHIEEGETVGLIGLNGSGKTTLLKLIAGIVTPTTGSIALSGKSISLIEIGAGFHPDLTGYENIYLNGLLLGMRKSEIDEYYESIIKFAGLHDFISCPLYTYSDGMKIRLGFSVAIHARPDVLLLDENIYAGDQDFQIKIQSKLSDFNKQHKTIVIASHLLDVITKICNKVVWLEKGQIRLIGKPQIVIKQYLTQVYQKEGGL